MGAELALQRRGRVVRQQGYVCELAQRRSALTRQRRGLVWMSEGLQRRAHQVGGARAGALNCRHCRADQVSQRRQQREQAAL